MVACRILTFIPIRNMRSELHLISGALGTVVGIYETAVDGICGQKGVYSKIIASTATIRRAIY